MNCPRVNRLLGVYSELDRSERRLVDAHVRACTACRQAWHDEVRIRSLIQRIDDWEPPPGLEARLRLAPTMVPALPSGIAGGLAARLGMLAIAALAVTAVLGIAGREGLTIGGLAEGLAGRAGAGSAVTLESAGNARSPGTAPDAVPRSRPVEITTPEGDAGRPTTRRSAGRPSAPRPAPAGLTSVGLAGADPRPGSLIPPQTPRTPPGTAPLEPHHRGGDRGGANRDRAAATARPAATAPSTAAPPAPHACAVITARVFADVAGDGALDGCPGCDGRWSSHDQARAAELGVVLPEGLLIDVYDAIDAPLGEVIVVDRGTRVPEATVALGELCGVFPLTVQISALSGWAPCPAVGTSATRVTAPGPSVVDFPLTLGCPAPSATATPSPAPSATPTTPSVAPAGPTAGADPTEITLQATPTPVAVTATPEPRPSPALAATPATAIPLPGAPIRWRPTATPTPTTQPPAGRPAPGAPKITAPPDPPPWPTSTPEAGATVRAARSP